MSVGQMNEFCELVKEVTVEDSDGFTNTQEQIIARFRAYHEQRKATKMWSNLASFSTATDLFRFRVIPGVKVTEDMYLVADSTKYEIESVDDHKGKGLYLEILARRVTPNGKCSSEDA